MNKYKIGFVCMIALGSLSMNTADVSASDNNAVNSSQVRSGEFDPTTSEYYNAPVSEAEYQEKWEAASIKGDTKGNQTFGGGQWYLDGDDLHIGDVNLKNNGTSASTRNKGTISKNIIKTISGIDESNINLYLDKEIDGKDYLFYEFKGKAIYGLNNIKASDDGDYSSMFSSSGGFSTDFRLLDTSKVTNMNSMFEGSKVTKLDVSNWDTGKVTDMDSMFERSQVTKLDVSNWDTSNVTFMGDMFYYSKITELDVSKWDTSNVKNMKYMFGSSQVTNLDVSKWNTGNVTNMRVMFMSSEVTNLDVSNWDTSNVTDMNSMFSSSKVTELDVSKWDTSNVTDMGRMFTNINNIETLKLGGFNKNAPISSDSWAITLSSTNKVKNIDFTGFNFDERHLSYIEAPNIQTMYINETIYMPDRASSPFDLKKFPKNWRLVSDHSITATSDELHTSTVVRDHPGLWEAYTPHLSLSTSTPNIVFNDVKLGSSMTNIIKLNLDYDSANGVVLSQKASRDDNQFSLKRNSDNYSLSTISKEVYTSTSNKAVEELEYELEFNPTKLGAADNSITWTLSYKI